MKKNKDINSYIKNSSKESQRQLKILYALVKKTAPVAEETISYGIPTFTLHGNLVHFGAFKDHISFFPTSSGVKAFKKKLSAYKVAKGTIQFRLNERLPSTLIAKIVKFRIKENVKKKKKQGVKKRTVKQSKGNI